MDMFNAGGAIVSEKLSYQGGRAQADMTVGDTEYVYRTSSTGDATCMYSCIDEGQ